MMRALHCGLRRSTEPIYLACQYARCAAPPRRRVGPSLLSLAFFFASPLFAGVIVLKNGDRITGEIKKLERGVLHVDSDYGKKVFEIDWDDVAAIDSDARFVAELSSGQRMTGTLRTQTKTLPELTIGDEEDVAVSDVVALQPLDYTFWGRWSGSLAGGYDFAKANSSQSTRLSSALDYTEDRWKAGAKLTINRTIQEGTDPARRRELTGSYARYLGTNRWFAAGLGSLLSNDEQRLRLRSTYGGAIGRYFIRSNRLDFGFLAGTAWTNELYEDPEIPRTNSAEGVLGLEYNAFNVGDLTFLTKLMVFPSLSQRGRVRLDFSSNVKWNLPKDLYVSSYLWNNYDSAPLNDAAKNDFGFGTAFGWDF